MVNMENKNKETIQVPIAMFEQALTYLKDYNKKLENFSNELNALVDAHNKGFKKGEEDAASKIYKMAKEYNNGYETDFDNFMKALKEIFNIETEE